MSESDNITVKITPLHQRIEFTQTLLLRGYSVKWEKKKELESFGFFENWYVVAWKIEEGTEEGTPI